MSQQVQASTADSRRRYEIPNVTRAQYDTLLAALNRHAQIATAAGSHGGSTASIHVAGRVGFALLDDVVEGVIREKLGDYVVVKR